MNLNRAPLFPSLQRRGGRDMKQDIAKPPRDGAAGVVGPAKPRIGAELTTPSARNKVASRLPIDRASTPPLRGGEWWIPLVLLLLCAACAPKDSNPQPGKLTI